MDLDFVRRGDTGLQTSEIQFGTWRFGRETEEGNVEIDEARAHELLDAYAEHGARFVDTADCLGVGDHREDQVEEHGVEGVVVERQRRCVPDPRVHVEAEFVDPVRRPIHHRRRDVDDSDRGPRRQVLEVDARTAAEDQYPVLTEVMFADNRVEEVRMGVERRDAATLRLYLDENAAVTRTERVQRRDQNDRRSG